MTALNNNSKKVFITRDLPANSVFKTNLASIGYEVIDCSLITTSLLRFSHAPLADWIFFTSKNSIMYFFEQNPVILRKTRFAVLGSGSASYLCEFGRKADFIGKGNDAVAIAKDFAGMLNAETVLFPMAIDSLQTVQRQLGFSNTAKNLYVYKTELRTNFSVPKADILIFTSPSNAEAYFSKYTIIPHQKVIAIGTTTRDFLLRKGIQRIYLPDSFSEESLLQKVWQLYTMQDSWSYLKDISTSRPSSSL